MIAEVALPRGRFLGVSRIVQFNWSQYAIGGICIVASLLLIGTVSMPGWLLLALALGTSLAAWWLLASLAASWWIYDLSPLMRLTWLGDAVPQSNASRRHILNVHSGYDDTSATLSELFPDDTLTVLDLFDAASMTEASIHRARRAYPSHSGTLNGRWDTWPIESQSSDLVLLLLSAHEFRISSERETLFAEANRVLIPGGKIVVAEHLRNGWNFAAFGPGFLHFWPRCEWLRLASVAKLRLVCEGRITPFVGYFILEN